MSEIPTPTPAPGRVMVDVKYVQAKLHIKDRRTISRLITKEGLPVHRVGRLMRFDPVEVDAWIDSRWSLYIDPEAL